jgi:hypothetical protein
MQSNGSALRLTVDTPREQRAGLARGPVKGKALDRSPLVVLDQLVGGRAVTVWTRQSELAGGLEERLADAVKQWIAQEWPFRRVAYPGRGIAWEEYEKLPSEKR